MKTMIAFLTMGLLIAADVVRVEAEEYSNIDETTARRMAVERYHQLFGDKYYLNPSDTARTIDTECNRWCSAKWDVVSDEQRLLHSLGGSQRVLINDQQPVLCLVLK